MWSVFFVFLSYLDRNVVRGDFLSSALDAEKESREMFSMINGTFCAKMSLIGENVLYQVSDGAEVVRTVVSPSGKLVTCSVVVNQMEVKSFLHECRLGLKKRRAGHQLEARFARIDEDKLLCREFNLRSEGSSAAWKNTDTEGGQEKVLKRSKRGFTYPGTLWCGAGNMADNYNQLGEFADTDSCCRTHDHCAHVIHAFSSNYGYTNFKWHSLSHCDCDDELKACLRKVNDTSSRVVGQAFFNVIGVPCFDFTYEEQCAERHWYGLCKRYEKFPIAVLREAVPYDYGGIDVIDELTLAPPKREESTKRKEEEQQESPTQSTISEPSLTNVVTAAEDFIKLLATVSTSQSSNADHDKEETQASEKKKRKNMGKKKKTNKKHKGKGKGRKKKQKTDAGLKAEEGAVVPPPGSKAEDVLALSNFISESSKQDRSKINTNRVEDREFEPRRTDERSNAVMKDEPAADMETVSIMSPENVQKVLAESETEEIKEKALLSDRMTTVRPHKTKTKGQRRGQRKKSKKMPPSPEDVNLNSADSVPNITDILKQRSEQHSSSKTSTATIPIVVPKVQRSRSKDRGDKEGRKKRKKVSSDAPIVPSDLQNSSPDRLTAFPHPQSPTTAPVPTTELPLLITPFYRPDSQLTALSPNFTALKRRRSKDRVQRNRRRKTAILPSSQNHPFSHSSPENVNVLTTPHTLVTQQSPVSTAALQDMDAHNEWRLFTTASPTVRTNLRVHLSKQQKKSNLKPNDPNTLPVSPAEVRSNKHWMTTMMAPSMSPLHFSIERARAQFNRKKRRKALLLNRQQ
ncbi:PREDICTED: protein PROCA1 [Cyprinodon variegatus]|uniref:phospholipase A2 n=1 Tax=Cyprinodon variegatus TaxID=28743 RepID=A0A3Q2ECD3_CYPVA|nr:PREDICTED: protein PROCA1 [Cyprinodon variegatus]